ncbi:Polcalcin Ole e 3 [Acorus calamus]|uniref:Polcalcin Ole e 3 n=1 Tax=Acorus calamus TaxID=4465 RepID=A0AAV9E8P8_ACOCL|nr:Polcalcin Ole e 3 [Acorus calamus]
MASDPTKEETEEVKRIFNRFNANGDGKISSAELGDVLRTFGSASADEIQRMMSEIDRDGDGFIDFDEFLEFHRANKGLLKDVAKAF